MTRLGSSGIRAGRDRVVAVLSQHLGPIVARERANNIAQALAFNASDPATITLEMLRDVPLRDVANAADIAAAVSRAWNSHASDVGT